MLAGEVTARVAAGRPLRFGLERRLTLSTLLLTGLLLATGFLVLFPIWQILLQSFQDPTPGQHSAWSLSGWQAVFGERSLRSAIWNTLTVTVARQGITLVAGVFIAWLLARTDVPGARFFEFIFWLAFFLPSLTLTLSWILVLDPQFGIANQVLRYLGLAQGTSGPFDIYSYWGIVWVHVIGTNLAVKVMLLTPAFRNMNAAFEEASHASGAGSLTTGARIFIPLMLPVILAVELLALLRSLEAFEIEQILGVPIGFRVFSTWIYDALNQQNPRYDAVSALSVLTILAAIACVFLQRWLLAGRRYTTVTGRFGGQVLHLGRWRWPAWGLLAFLVALIVAVPLVLSTMGTFMKLFGFFIAEPWTLRHWQTAFSDPQMARSLQNTLILATGTTVLSVLGLTLIAYVIVRTRYFARGALDVLSWIPFTVPGIILSLGMLTMFLRPPFRPLYGSLFTLMLSLIIAGMPLTVQIMKGNLLQLGNELEEASWASGGSWWYTYRRVVLPLISPSLVVVGVISFLGTARNISQVALLSNTANLPLSMLQLNYLADGKYEVAAVIATILLLVCLVLALLARVFGYKGPST